MPGDCNHLIRTADFKYIRFNNSNEDEVYDLRNDPHEGVNLATDPRHAATKADLRRRLEQWDRRYSAGVPDATLLAAQKKYAGWKGLVSPEGH